jgi:hypothetical protein
MLCIAAATSCDGNMFQLVLTSILIYGVVLGSISATANESHFYRGEGNVLEAYIALNRANDFRLLMTCQQKTRSNKKVKLGLQIGVDDNAKVSPEVIKLRKVPEDAQKSLDVCINSRCNTYVWEHSDYGSDESGGPLITDITIDQSGGKIRSVRLVVPNDATNYEFEGDVDGILEKICRSR